MSKWKHLQRRRTFDLRGRVSESHLCVDCGFNTAPGSLNREEAERALAQHRYYKAHVNSQTEMYMVHNYVWQAAGM
jgi:hypothetical protein